jgi:hypothetical protein
MELRCKYKRAYSNSAAALSALQKHNIAAKENGWKKLTSYYCCEYCKLWHTTSLPAKLWASQKKFHEQRIKDGKLADSEKSHVGKLKKSKR